MLTETPAARDIVGALFELFAEVDDVFTEQGTVTNPTLGRLYRSWRKARAAIDPDFNSENYPETSKPRKNLDR